MMISYYLRNGDSSDLERLTEYRPNSWVSVEAPTEKDINFLVEKFDLDPGHMSDALDPDEMPRLEREGSANYIFIRYAYTDEEMELTTAPLLFVIGPDFFITIALHALPRLQRVLNGRIDFATSQQSKLMLVILNQIAEQYEVFINNISRQIKAIRNRLKTHDVSNQDFIDFVQIEDELNEFLSALQPTTAILRRLMLGRHIVMHKEDQDIVEDLLLNNEQSIEGCLSNVKSIANIRDAYSTIASNNLNRTMKILTAATVILTLPTIFFSMYGMNLELPYADESWAFLAVAGLTIVIMALTVALGRAKRLF